jgi:hypothetical protein
MPISTADAKKRVVVATARPGDVFEIQSQGEGRLLLVRLGAPKAAPKMRRAGCLKAIASAPLRTTTSWLALRAMTREP